VRNEADAVQDLVHWLPTSDEEYAVAPAVD
jgi:hypothetical protein